MPVTSGVPQGSVLGPLLFLIFVNDITNVVTSDIKLFADDTVLFRRIRSQADQEILQTDLSNIVKWCETNKMSLNIDKCKYLKISRCHNTLDYNYTIKQTPLEQVEKYKYLGIYITSHLHWETHIDYICSKAHQSLGFVRRQLHKCTPMVKLRAYQTLVRPHLEYASCVWDPHSD